MKTVKPRMTLLSATISALVLVGCQSEPRYEGQQVTVPRQQQVTVPEAAPIGVVTGARNGSAQERTLVAQDMVGQAWGPALVKMAPPQFTSTERYQGFADNGVVSTREQPLSTFSIDVDTGSYSNVRRFLESGQLPPVDAVRTEELVNYFAYDYPVDTAGEVPFSVYTEVAPSPWNAGRHLLHIGIQAVVPEVEEPPARNLVFLVDVSGSMHQPDKLPLLVSSLKLLTRQLDANDRISLVVYAGGAGVVLEPTPGDQQAAILRALDSLQAGGGTNGAAGIKEAYALAEAHFVEGGINRVLLATDGDFNVGLSDVDALKRLIEAKRRSGISLTTLGFGTGNYNDHLMEQLADIGNGNYAYIDSIHEARKVLVEELGATLQTVASDVKIQIEFNPAQVAEYRLVGYENRVLANEDFNNDKVDAGEIGAGHSVTALYELTLVGSDARMVDPLRYVQPAEVVLEASEELAFLKLRYKRPGSERSELIERPLTREQLVAEVGETSNNFRFAAAVAGFGQLLRGNVASGDFGWNEVLSLAEGAQGADVSGYRSGFIGLLRTTRLLAEN